MLGLVLHLVCGGAGTATKPDFTFVDGSTSYGSEFSATAMGTRDRNFADEVSVRLDDADPRIRLPRSMLPPARGGKDGWFKIKNLKITDQDITGSAAVNFINNPKFRLDRITGSISISGKAGDYSGRCEPFDPATAPRKF